MGAPATSYQILFGFILAGLTGQLAWQARALNVSGAWAATLIGGIIFGFGGYPWAILLLAFFTSSSALSRLFAKQKADLAEKFEKGSRRDWVQVFANGGLGAFLALVWTVNPGEVWPWMAFAGAMASVTADTWATELGVLSKTPPRLITTRKEVDRGTSGGISRLGTIATFGGAFLVALLGWLVFPAPGLFASLAAISLGGLAGSLADSFLGATVQAIYYDPKREKETERRPAKEIPPLRGWVWMTNDMVNFISSIIGALVSTAIWILIGWPLQ